MDDSKWERYGALGGIWFVVLAVVGAFLSGSLPDRNDPASEIAEFFVDNDTAIQAWAFLTAIGVIGLIWWFGSLWRRMSRAEGGLPRLSVVALLGLVISGIGATIGLALNAGTAAAIDVAGEGSAIFYEIAAVAFALSNIGDVILTVAVAVLIARTGFLPMWAAYVSIASAIVSLVASIGIVSDEDFFVVFGLIAFLVWAAWVLIISILMYTRPSTVSPAVTVVTAEIPG